MNFWDFLMGRWPSERQWVTIWVVVLFVAMLAMAYFQPSLWEVETFKTILQAVVITGLINMVLAFHFSANQGQQQSSQNASDALQMIREARQREDERAAGGTEDPEHGEEASEPPRRRP